MKLTQKKIISVAIVVFLILSYMMLQYYTTKDLKSLPTCYYGCDYYYENGIQLDLINNPTNTHLSASHDWLGQPNSLPKGLHYVRALIGSFLPIEDQWKSQIYFVYIFIIIGIISSFILFNRIFNNNLYLSTLGTIIMVSPNLIPHFKYSHMFYMLIPLVILISLKIFDYDKWDKKSILFTILSIPFLIFFANTHAVGFFLLIMMIGFSYVYFNLEIPKLYHTKDKIKHIKGIFKNKKFIFSTQLTLILIFSVIIFNLSFGWWHVAIIEEGTEINANKFDAYTDLTKPSNYFSETINYTQRTFFDTKNIYTILMGLLSIVAIVMLFLTRKSKNHVVDTSRWIIIFFILAVFNYLITIPLLGRDLQPLKFQNFLYPTLYAFSVTFLGYLLTKSNIYEKYKPQINMTIGVFILFILLFNFNYSINIHEKRGFWANGYQEIPEHYQELQKYLNSNDLIDKSVIVTNNELSFAVHGMTGSKLLLGRQAHFFLFGDFQKIWMDSAIILYGNNEQNRYETLKKYKELAAKDGRELYLYWDTNWINLEWQINPNDGSASPFDPIRFEYSPQREQTLKENNISYMIRENAIFEPSAQNKPNVYKMDIMYVTPQNYNNFTHPWNLDLNNYLEKVWSVNNGNQDIAVLYKINIE